MAPRRTASRSVEELMAIVDAEPFDDRPVTATDVNNATVTRMADLHPRS